MKMTLGEAAHYLGKSERQVRYLIKLGQIKGNKVEGRWVFDQADLPVSKERLRVREQKAAELGAAVEEALGPHLRPPSRRTYSVADLGAFRAGVAACRSSGARLGEHAATTAMRASLVALSQGCHRFHQREKADAFRAARERAAEAVALLHVEGSEVARSIADSVEQDYITALVGLLRRQERRSAAP